MLLPARDIALFDPEELIEEASSFPSGAHDDLVDATSQALAVMMFDRAARRPGSPGPGGKPGKLRDSLTTRA